MQITADAKTKTYGDDDPEFTYSASGLVYADQTSIISGALTREQGETVKELGYVINENPSNPFSAAGDNYNISYISAKLTINRKPLNITNLRVTKEYDRTNTINSNLVSADSAKVSLGILDRDSSNVNITLVGSNSSFNDKQVGSAKTITISGLSLSGNTSANYVLNPANGSGTVRGGGTITAKQLNIDKLQVIKVYDGNTTITADLINNAKSSLGVISFDDVTFSLNETTSRFTDRHVGTSKNGTIKDLAITNTGADGVNYRLDLTTFDGNIGDITKKPLTVVLTGTVSKEYDGNVNASVAPENYNLSGIINGDTVVLNNPSIGTYDDRLVGVNKVVAVSGLEISGQDEGNYILSFNTASNNVGIINRKRVTVNYTGSISKAYDGSVDAGDALNSVSFFLPGTMVESVDYNQVALLVGTITGTYDNANYGNGKTVTIYSGLSLSGSSAGNYILNNKVYNGVITKKTVTVAVAPGNTISKVYDAGTTASLNGISFNFASGSVISEDLSKVVLSQSSVRGTYIDANVGNNKVITLQNLTIAKAANVADANDVSGNYQMESLLTVSGDITTLPLTVTVNPPNQTTFNKVYDGTTHFTIPSGTTYALSSTNSQVTLPANVSNIQVDESNIAASYDNSSVGSNKIITFTGLGLMKSPSAVDDVSSNYSISGNVTARGSISLGSQNQLIVTVNLPSSGTNLLSKVYNGTTSFTIPIGTTYTLSSSGNIPDLISNLAVDSQSVSAFYNDIHTGLNKTITFENLRLVKSSSATTDVSGNYLIATPVILSNGIITAKPIDAVVNLPASYSLSKLYDGSNTFSIPSGTSYSLDNNQILLSDRNHLDIDSSSVSAEYDNMNAGSNKVITFNNLRLQKAANVVNDITGDYTITANPNIIGGSITAKEISVISNDTITKVYDGTTTAYFNNITFSLGANQILLVDDNQVTLSVGTITGTYDNAHYGNGKTVTIDSGLSLSGSSAGNYILNNRINNASITRKTVRIEPGYTIIKVYDGNTTAVLTGITFNFARNAIIPQDDSRVVLSGSVTGEYDNPNCGENKNISLSGLTLTNVSSNVQPAEDVSGNYTLESPPKVTGNITPFQVTTTPLPPTGQTTFNKDYNGNVDFTIPAGTTYPLRPAVAGKTLPSNTNDNIEVNPDNIRATYDNPNVGQQKIINFSGISLKKKDTASTDVSTNYEIPNQVTAQGEIRAGTRNLLRVIVNLGGTNTSLAKTYDASSTFQIPTGTTYTLSGSAVPGDNLNDIEVDTTKVISASYSDSNVGENKTINFYQLALKTVNGAVKDISGNYSIETPVTLGNGIINPKRLSITVNLPAGHSLSKVYDATDSFSIPLGIAYNLNDSEIPSLDRGHIAVNSDASVSAKYNSADVAEGKVITFNGLSLKRPAGSTKDVVSNYTISASPQITGGSITPKTVSISATGSFNKVYDGNNRFGLNTITVNFRSGDIEVADQDKVNLSTTGAVATYDNSNAGSRSVTISGLSIAGAKQDNYVLNAAQYTISNCSITARNVTVSAYPQTKEYGANDPSLSYNASELVTGESLKGALSRVAGESVAQSPYAINQGTLTNINNNNYNISYTGNSLTITKAVLNVTANSYEKIQDQPNPTFDVSYSGFKFNDSSILIKDQVTISTAAKVDSPIGSYAINVSGPENIDNYTIKYVNGTLRIRSVFPQILSRRDYLIGTLNESNITIDALNNLLNANAINTPNSSYIFSNKINYAVNNLIFINNNSVAFRNLKLLMFPKNTRSLADFFGIRPFNVLVEAGYINIIRNFY